MPKIRTLLRALGKTVRPFITNKDTISDENIKIKTEKTQKIKIKIKTKTNDCIKDESVVVEMFNVQL